MLMENLLNIWRAFFAKKSSRRLGLVLLLLVGVLLYVGGKRLWKELGGVDRTWERIQRTGVLRVGMDASYPPFEWLDKSGRFRGVDVELARALAERWGVEVQFINIHFDGLYDALKTAKCDLIISALPYDRTMTKDVLYSQSYFNAGQVLLVRVDGPNIRTPEDLDGRVVGVELGAEAHQLARLLQREKDLQILVRREPEDVLALLLQAKVAAIICDRVTACEYLQQHRELRLVEPPLTDAPYVIAVPLGSFVLLEQVNLALSEWRANGFLATLQRRCF